MSLALYDTNFQKSCNIIRRVRRHRQSLKKSDNLKATNLTQSLKKQAPTIIVYQAFL